MFTSFLEEPSLHHQELTEPNSVWEHNMISKDLHLDPQNFIDPIVEV